MQHTSTTPAPTSVRITATVRYAKKGFVPMSSSQSRKRSPHPAPFGAGRWLTTYPAGVAVPGIGGRFGFSSALKVRFAASTLLRCTTTPASDMRLRSRCPFRFAWILVAATDARLAFAAKLGAAEAIPSEPRCAADVVAAATAAFIKRDSIWRRAR